MKDLLIELRTALGLAKSMAEREGYDTDVYTKRIEMIDKVLRKPAVSKSSLNEEWNAGYNRGCEDTHAFYNNQIG
jgi:hypothetical protein